MARKVRTEIIGEYKELDKETKDLAQLKNAIKMTNNRAGSYMEDLEQDKKRKCDVTNQKECHNAILKYGLKSDFFHYLIEIYGLFIFLANIYP